MYCDGNRQLRSPGSERVLIVSNRLPFTVRRDGQSFHLERSDGGLSNGLLTVHERRRSSWIGWAGTAESDEHRFGPRQCFEHVGCTPVPLHSAEVNGFYRQYSNSLLWPVLHGWNGGSCCSARDWEFYCQVNQRFAEVVAAEVRPGDCVWIHDYHLMLVPGFLRRIGCHAPVGFFLHTPFPEPATFGGLPRHHELLTGLMGADVIGVHTAKYAQCFLATVAGILHHPVRGRHIETDERCVRVCAAPMGIDFAAFNAPADEPAVLKEAAALRASSPALLLGVDRLDYTKGVLERLLAFEQLLRRYPRFRHQVRLLQIAVPTREGVPAYQALRQSVESTVDRINTTFGTSDWVPVDYRFGSIPRRTLIALYRAADVMLVTPLCDGLNLVAKEFIASRTDEDGVLILSRFAGAALELQDALLVTPQRIDELTDACERALSMSAAERQRRMRSLRKAVAGNDIVEWADRMILRIRVAGREQSDRGARAFLTSAAR